MSSRSSSRERVVNLFTITLVTILIWMWAAGETRRTEQAFATLALVPPTEGTLRVTPDDIPNVEFEIRGSQRAVSAAVEPLPPADRDPGGFEGASGRARRAPASLEDLGEALVEEWRLPVTIMSADPPSIAVTIESLLSEEARVVPSLLPAPPGSSATPRSPPTVTTMILPGDQATQAQLGDLVLDARVSSDDLDGRLPGALHRIQVPLVIPGSPPDSGPPGSIPTRSGSSPQRPGHAHPRFQRGRTGTAESGSRPDRRAARGRWTTGSSRSMPAAPSFETSWSAVRRT